MARRSVKVKERPQDQNEKVVAKQNKSKKDLKSFWWKNDEDPHVEVFAVLKHLDNTQGLRSLLNQHYLRLYGSNPLVDYGSMESALALGMPLDRLSLNIIKSVINTKKARITRNTPRTRFLTSGADFQRRRRALGLEQFCVGVNYQNKTKGKLQKAYLHADTMGTGAIYVFEEDGKVCNEHVHTDELVVDEWECRDGNAYTLYRRKFVPREVVREEWSKEFGEEAIDAAPNAFKNRESNANTGDFIALVEAWHLPVNSQNSDGAHVYAIEGASYREDWKRKRFPIAFLRSEERPEGFYGEGAAERLQSVQIELNKLVNDAHNGIHLMTAPFWIIGDDDIPDEWITNEWGRFLRSNNPGGIRKEVSNSVPPEVWQRIDALFSQGYDLEGVSQMSASGRKEAGVDAAVAMREKDDIEAARFAPLAQAYEQFQVDVDELQVELAAEIYGRTGKYKVQAPILDSDIMEEIDWKKVNLPRDAYIMQPYPASQLPNSPSGRAQWIEERMESGLISIETGRQLLQIPDIKSAANRDTAAANDIDRVIDHMLHSDGEDENVYQPPEPFQNLELGIERCTSAYLNGRMTKVPDDRLELLRRWIDDAHAMIKQNKDEAAAAQAAAAPAQQAPPVDVPPGGLPMAAPPDAGAGPVA